MTDEELMAQRAARTGRPLPAAQTGAATNRFPGQADPGRSPTADMGASDLGNNDGGNGAPPDGQPAAYTAPQQDSTHQQLQAALGRLTPLQQQLADRDALLRSQQQQMAELRAQLEAREEEQRTHAAERAAEDFDPLAGLSQDVLDGIDPLVLEAMRASGRASVASIRKAYQDPQELVRRTMQEHDSKRCNIYINQVATELDLMRLGEDATFTKFLSEDDSASILMNSFVAATDLRSAETLAPRVRKMVSRYQQSVNATPRTPDPKDALASHMQRGASSPSAAGARNIQPSDARAIRNAHAMAVRSGNKDEASRLLKLLESK